MERPYLKEYKEGNFVSQADGHVDLNLRCLGGLLDVTLHLIGFLNFNTINTLN